MLFDNRNDDACTGINNTVLWYETSVNSVSIIY